MRKQAVIISVVVLVLIVIMVTVVGCPRPEKHVIFTTGAWSGDWLTIYVPKILLEEELGYTTEIKETSVLEAWAAIGAGEADLWTDSFLGGRSHSFLFNLS